MTAQQIIEAAYARSTANDPGKLATDGEMISVLDRLFQALYAVRAAAEPSGALARANLAALAGSPASATLPTDMIDLRRVQRNSDSAKVNVIPVEEIDRSWHLAPAIYRQGNSVVSRGGAGDPVAGDTLTIFHLDAPATITALVSVLDARFPVRHHELLVVELAIYLATKDAGARQAPEFQALVNTRNMYLETFMRLSGLSMTALQSPHGGVIMQRLNSLLQASKSDG